MCLSFGTPLQNRIASETASNMRKSHNRPRNDRDFEVLCLKLLRTYRGMHLTPETPTSVVSG